MRFFVELSYNGKQYHGWQIQPNANTVQAELNRAFSTILNQEVELVGAGRTDTGVHAKQMFAHFDFNQAINAKKTILQLNGFLPDDIVIQDIYNVENDAHARFDALSRTYQYFITDKKNPFNANCYSYHKTLDVEAMNSACAHLLGKQDFSSFSKVHTQTYTNDCTISSAKWEQQDEMLVFTITADRFLRNMVRAIVGTLLEVGEGKIKADEIKNIIAKKNRSKAGVSVPAHALFLTKIEYPKSYNS